MLEDLERKLFIFYKCKQVTLSNDFFMWILQAWTRMSWTSWMGGSDIFIKTKELGKYWLEEFLVWDNSFRKTEGLTEYKQALELRKKYI